MHAKLRNSACAVLCALLGSGSALAAPPAASPNCKSAEHHQFDFWIGRWDVFDTKTKDRAGSSLIEGLYRGCVLRENWTDDQLVGGSLNIYDKTDHKWHQTWTDSAGSDRLFIGGFDHGRMVLVSSFASQKFPGKTVLYRMTFTPNKDGSVRQYSDLSSDDGKNWKTNYDYTYKRTK